MKALSVRMLLLIVVCLLGASVLIDFVSKALSMLIDGVLAAAVIYVIWRIKGSYEGRIRDLEAEVRLLSARTGG